MERQYTAFADTGTDYISFEFYSTHRANSRANHENAIDFYRRRYGHSVKIMRTVYNKEPIV